MPIDIDNFNRDTNVSEDEELRALRMKHHFREMVKEEIVAGPKGADLCHLHEISADELMSEPRGVNVRMQSIDDIAPNVAQACQWVIPPAVKNFWQASSQAYISDMMGNAMDTWVTEDNSTWRYVDGTERPDDTPDS